MNLTALVIELKMGTRVGNSYLLAVINGKKSCGIAWAWIADLTRYILVYQCPNDGVCVGGDSGG